MSIEARIERLMADLASRGSEDGRLGMARYGIETSRAYGVSVYELRRMAKDLGKDHQLALALWETGNHEARILASMVDDPACVTAEQMDRWAAEFDSWDVCDQVTSNLFDKTAHAYEMVRRWSSDEREFVKRAAFATAAALAVQDKAAPDEAFLEILELVQREAGDGRNFVKKAVSWALRNIGKRDRALHAAAVTMAEAILASAEARAAADRTDPAPRSARWVARDALRELRTEKVLQRLGIAPGD